MLSNLFSKLGLLSVVCSLLLSTSVQAAEPWQEASHIIDTKTKSIISLVRNKDFSTAEQVNALLADIDNQLSPVIDFPHIARQVMGKYYRKANAKQRSTFAEVFKTTLLKTYTKALVEFKINSYEIMPPRRKSPDANKQIVSVNVYTIDNTKYTLVYYMLKKKGEWKLVNAVLDGSVNIRLNFKSQFAEMVQQNQGDIGKVIAIWQDKMDSASGNYK